MTAKKKKSYIGFKEDFVASIYGYKPNRIHPKGEVAMYIDDAFYTPSITTKQARWIGEALIAAADYAEGK